MGTRHAAGLAIVGVAACAACAAPSRGPTPAAARTRAVQQVVLQVLADGFRCGRAPVIRCVITDTTVRVPGNARSQRDRVPPAFQPAVAALLRTDRGSAERVAAFPGLPAVSGTPLDTTVGRPYPPQCAVLHVSRAGFDATGGRAAVYAEIWCGDTGHGELVLLERVGGAWQPRGWINLFAAG